MKNFTKIVLSIALSTSLSAFAFDQSLPVRVVVKHKESQSKRANLFSVQASALELNANIIEVKKSVSILEVNEEEAQETVNSLLQSGQFEKVEVDFQVSSPDSNFYKEIIHSVNDVAGTQSLQDPTLDDTNPLLKNQYHWHNNEKTTEEVNVKGFTPQKGNHNLFRANQYVLDIDRPVIGFVDSGFKPHSDLDFGSKGFSFVTSFGEVRNENFNATPDVCDNMAMHGTMTWGVFAAKDNDAGIKGMTGFDMVSARVAKCNVGYMSDIADAIYWLSGSDQVAYTETTKVPALERKADIINISMAGNVKNAEEPELTVCPFYLQEAIDYAVAKGVTVVAAAGNNAEDTKYYAPANCKGVITVSGTLSNGAPDNTLNYGDRVDVNAAGTFVYTTGFNDDMTETYHLIGGSSFSAPVVTSILMMTKKQFPDATKEEMLFNLKASSVNMNREDPANACDNNTDKNDRCTKGVVDGLRMLKLTDAYRSGKNISIEHALSGSTPCEQKIFRDHFNGQYKLCEMTIIKTDVEGLENSRVEYKIYRTPKAEAFDVNTSELLMTTDQKRVRLGNVDTETFKYGLVSCIDGACQTKVREFDLTKAQKPASCK